jgi:quercetin dioxygenase-like cupin family protein
MLMSRTVILVVACTALGFAAGLFAAARSPMIIAPIEAAVFKPADPSRPQGAHIAVLRGDPQTGPSSMLMKFGKGTGRMHIHSSDYDLVVLKGEMKHWHPGETEKGAKVLGAGSYWFQPGNEAHVDSCLSDECLMYVQWSGKRDSRLPEASHVN